MTTVRVSQASWSQGEVGPYFLGRADNKIYAAACKQLENFILLPQGGVMRRAGFEYVDTAVSATLRLANFNFSITQQYLLVFTDSSIAIYRNGLKVATVATSYAAIDLPALRFTQSTDTMIIVHPSYAPMQLFRNGSDSSWTFSALAFVNLPYYRYNIAQTCAPSATTGAISLTLSGSTAYWTSDHIGTLITVNGGTASITAISSGTVASANVVSTLQNTNADPSWTEQGWSARHGWPRTATFYQNRLVFGGTRDAPSTVFASNVGDFFNFTATTVVNNVTQVTDSNCFVFTISSDQQLTIVNLFGSIDLLIFTDQAEYRCTGGYQTPVTPTNVQLIPQSNYGSANTAVFQIDLQIIYATGNLKELRGMQYQYIYDRWISDDYTLVANHIFSPTAYPTSMALLKSYANTQGNYVCATRSDGTLTLLCINNEKEVLGWSRFTTQGTFLACCVVAVTDGNGATRDTLFAAVQRTNGVFIEALSDFTIAPVYMDCWFAGTNATPKTTWSGLTPLENQTVQVVGDGLVETPVTVSNTGSFTLAKAASTIYAGLGYTSTFETLPYSFAVEGKLKRGERIRKIRAFINLYNTQALKIDGYDVALRALGSDLLDQPLPSFTGTVQVRLGGPSDGISTDPTLVATVTEPLSCCILSISTDLEVRDD